MGGRAFALTTVCVVVLSPNAVLRGQEPAPAQTAAKPAAAPDFLHQEELTGDWKGGLAVLVGGNQSRNPLLAARWLRAPARSAR